MRASVEQDLLEKTQAERLVAETPLMDGIEGISVELGEDHTGDPSMWLVFRMRHDLVADTAWIRRFNEYSGSLSLAIIDSGLTRFPYLRLDRAA